MINSLFPNEQSLTNLEDVILEMTDRIDSLDSEVSDLIREDNSSGMESEKILEETQKEIANLVKSISQIKSKAEESEKMVSEITRDIKQLDQAKKNLTAAITTLNHLHIVRIRKIRSFCHQYFGIQYSRALKPENVSQKRPIRS